MWRYPQSQMRYLLDNKRTVILLDFCLFFSPRFVMFHSAWLKLNMNAWSISFWEGHLRFEQNYLFINNILSLLQICGTKNILHEIKEDFSCGRSQRNIKLKSVTFLSTLTHRNNNNKDSHTFRRIDPHLFEKPPAPPPQKNKKSTSIVKPKTAQNSIHMHE